MSYFVIRRINCILKSLLVIFCSRGMLEINQLSFLSNYWAMTWIQSIQYSSQTTQASCLYYYSKTVSEL